MKSSHKFRLDDECSLIHTVQQLAPESDIPIVLEGAGLLAAFTHPNRLLFVGSRGFAQLPPTCISNSNGYTHVFMGLEASDVVQLRALLQHEFNLDRGDILAVGYWKQGINTDRCSEEKRESSL